MMRRLAWLALCLAACDTTDSTPATTEAVFVGNRGASSDTGGSLTGFDPAAGVAVPDVVAVPGALVQSLTVYNDRLYVLLTYDDSPTTGMGRIDVIDLATGQRVRQIDVRAPREMAVAGGTAYVTNLYSATVTPVYLATWQTGAPIPVGTNPEGVVVVGQRVYVANSGLGSSDILSVISTETNANLGQNVTVCTGPRTLLADDEAEVWVVCTGRANAAGEVEVPGEVVVLNGGSGAVVARFPLTGVVGTPAGGQDAAFSPSRDEAFVAYGAGLLRFDTATNTAAGEVAVGGALISAVAFDDAADRLYLGRLDETDPLSANGAVTVHDPETGAEATRFAAGVAPVAIAFRPASGVATR